MSDGRVVRVLRQRGADLIEVAVSLLVLSIGTLGLGGSQISAKRIGYEAVQRGEAAALAMDLLERLRANRTVLGLYSISDLGAGSGSHLDVPAADCGIVSCSPVQLTAWDLWQWEQALDGASTSGGAGGLVRPTACVSVIGRRVTLEIAWQGYRPLSSPLQQPTCGAGNYGPGDADRQWMRVTSWIAKE